MSYSKLILDMKKAITTPPTGVVITDLTTHATLFSNAVDDYVKSLMDPAQRKVFQSVKLAMQALLLALPTAPAPSSLAAVLAATQYQLAFTSYTATIIIDPSPISLPLGGIVVPPGNVISAKLIDTGLGLSIYSDFYEIFTEETPKIPEELLALQKATKFANAVKKAYTTKTNVLISGIDSTPLPPIPFSISGPLTES
jgi:hypothetical protein